MTGKPQTYDDWCDAVPSEITDDPLWRMEVYRRAAFAADLGWHDVSRLAQDRRTRNLADQLYRSLGSIAANIAEGYSRSSGRDQARFFEYALGSAREARQWYFHARFVLRAKVTEHRMRLLVMIIRLLLKMIPTQRAGTVNEAITAYDVTTPEGDGMLREGIPYAQPSDHAPRTTDHE
jgi:four helix bundle protein